MPVTLHVRVAWDICIPIRIWYCTPIRSCDTVPAAVKGI